MTESNVLYSVQAEALVTCTGTTCQGPTGVRMLYKSTLPFVLFWIDTMIVVETILDSNKDNPIQQTCFIANFVVETKDGWTTNNKSWNLQPRQDQHKTEIARQTGNRASSDIGGADHDNKCGDETWMWFGSWRLMIPTHSLIDGSAPVSDLYKSTPHEFNSYFVLSQHNHSVFN